MPRLILVAAVAVFSCFGSGSRQTSAQGPVAASLQEAAALPDFAVQGEYVSGPDANGNKALQVVALGKGNFRVVLYNGGLPGAGWDRQPPQVLEEESTDDVNELVSTLKLRKIERKSPTLGAAPPEGAVVLFDGSQASLEQHWQPGAKRTDDGLLMQGVTSKETFRDFTIHLEFQTSFMPEARGQARANSGAYYQGRYETQVLDSFGLEGKNNETGGIYEIRDPDLNMCLPPLSWQTYDVDFTAARFNAQGEKIANARMTVRLNGVIVQPEVEVPRVTRAAPVAESPEPGPIYLQDHGNPVRYRNIWVIPRDADAEARRPRIPGYERFLALGNDSEEAGRLLAGELGCRNCHKTDQESLDVATGKRAPILTDVANRVRPEWMLEFIARPHVAKPGTTMPALFEGWNDDERNAAVDALVNFLAAAGQPAERRTDREAMSRGERLFHQVGCTACHRPRDGRSVRDATTVPLPDVAAKYGFPGLVEFLKNPHAVRPSGRMPALLLEQKEAEDIAHYLTAGSTRTLPKNVRFAAYHGNWESLPNFAEHKPVAEGVCSGLDLTVANRSDQFGVVFTGFLKLDQAGDYTFALGSDDGSRLSIDDREIVNVDGIHPHSTKEARTRLEAGVHAVRIEYFEQGGEETIRLELAGPGVPRQDASLLLTTDPSGAPIKAEATNAEENLIVFHRDPSLIDKGRQLFTTLGCANCHEMKSENQPLTATLAPPAWNQLRTRSGCLSESPVSSSSKPLPHYSLVGGQRRHLEAALPVLGQAEIPSAERTIARTLTAFNCYACHDRGGLGGPEPDRNDLFATTQHEMGDEGRLPPSLTGVGDKLQEGWLKHVLANGAIERPYMLTRMPKFGGAPLEQLAQSLIEQDRRNEGALADFDDAPHRVKSTGRELVGNRGLACIKCHTFANYPATGIQAISLTGMTRRIRPEWFVRYLYDPARYRPGTRMPTGYPNGQAVIRNIYGGDPSRQISAVWNYLTDGNKAGIPEGLIADMIELIPESEPIIYRNFLEGLSPRGIAVGYPEKGHLAWDANELCLKLIWHDRFIDASKHWTGRGPGPQSPLGDHILSVEPTFAFAVLESQDSPWPSQSLRNRSGFQFKGYSLNAKGEPTFLIETPFGKISDFPEPVAKNSREGTFRRVLTVTAEQPVENLYFRAAVGRTIEQTPAGYLVNDALVVRVSGGGEPVVRDRDGNKELLVPVHFENGRATLTQELLW